MTNPVNPNPKNFRIIKHQHIRHYLVMHVVYPNCTNFEGNKILVFRDVIDPTSLLNATDLDPHFFPDSKLVARFVPTNIGWHMALDMCKSL